MQAIYEIEFMVKGNLERHSDTRRKIAPATLAGFLRIVEWAKDRVESHEVIGSIRIIVAEKP